MIAPEKILAVAAAVVLLALGIWAVSYYWSRRGKDFEESARRHGGTFRPTGTNDTELRLDPNAKDAALIAGAEHPPLLWRDLAGFSLFDRETHASRLLHNLIEITKLESRMVVFDYQYVETAPGPAVDDKAVTRNLTVIFVSGPIKGHLQELATGWTSEITPHATIWFQANKLQPKTVVDQFLAAFNGQRPIKCGVLPKN